MQGMAQGMASCGSSSSVRTNVRAGTFSEPERRRGEGRGGEERGGRRGEGREGEWSRVGG